LRIAVTGSSGLIGSHLLGTLTAAGHRVVRITRQASSTSGSALSALSVQARRDRVEQVLWDPAVGTIDSIALRGVDAIIHLAGEPIGLRWSLEKKARIRDSRVLGTALIVRAVSGLDPKPKVLVCASASGYYGDRGDETLTEDSPSGPGFLANVCQQWEQAAQPASDAGVRVVHSRFGFVLSRDRGVLGLMKWIFQSGLGGRFGSGSQWWPWIAIEDATGVLKFAVEQETLSGPVNAVSPMMVTNAEFTRTMAKVVARPAVLTAPAWALTLAFGEAAREVLLASQRMVPAKLQKAGFQWLLPDLELALRRQLKYRPEENNG
jgi:uncharacterized protein (TIGR01777 family)